MCVQHIPLPRQSSAAPAACDEQCDPDCVGAKKLPKQVHAEMRQLNRGGSCLGTALQAYHSHRCLIHVPGGVHDCHRCAQVCWILTSMRAGWCTICHQMSGTWYAQGMRGCVIEVCVQLPPPCTECKQTTPDRLCCKHY